MYPIGISRADLVPQQATCALSPIESHLWGTGGLATWGVRCHSE